MDEDEFSDDVVETIDGVFDDDVAESVVNCRALPALINKLRGLTGGNADLSAGYLGEVHELLVDDPGLKEWLVGQADAPAAWVASKVG